jgi:protein PsiE
VKLIPTVEKIIHSIIFILTLFLCGNEIYNIVVTRQVDMHNILALFIYVEIFVTINIFFSSGKIPVRYFLYISIFALARHISLENIVGIEALYLSASIALISLALVGLGYRDKLLNHKEPELE